MVEINIEKKFMLKVLVMDKKNMQVMEILFKLFFEF